MENYTRYILRILSLVSLLIFSMGCISRQLPTELQENPHRSDTLKESLGEKGDQPDNLIKERTIPKGLEEVSTPFGKMFIAVPPSTVQTEEEPPREDIKKAEEVSAINKSKKRDRVQTEKYNDAVRAAAKTGGRNESESPITLNFDDADIYEVIRSISEILNINYIIDTAVRGKVTIQTTGEIDRKDVWPVFFQILEANGLTAIREGKIYRIVPLKDAQRYAILSRYGTDSESVAPTERVIMQIIPLKYADGAEIVKIISPFVSEEGTIVSHGDSNTLIVVDKWINIMKVLQLVEVFDADILDKIEHRFFFLKYADSKETADMLEKIVSTSKNTGRSSFQLIPINRLNAILVVAKDDRIFNRIEAYLKEIDVPSDVSQRQIYVYSIKNGTAEELSSLLKNIFGSENSSNRQNKKEGNVQKSDLAPIEANNPFLQNSGTSKSGSESTDGNSGSGSSAVSGTLREKVNITPDSIRNALIIEATQSDYRIVENILSKLDVLPRQVLIEMTIAEIKLGDTTELGVQWNYKEGNPDNSLISGVIQGATGLNLGYGNSEIDRWSATLSAMAENKKAKILATPSIMASDNKEAAINISQEIPVISSVYDVSGSSSNVVTTNVQYRNTGLILTVTPHINENGLVSMSISQELSQQDKGVEIGGTTYPSFYKRTVDTSLVVKHNQTVVIGGLIQEDKEKNKSGVPLLSRIPVVGFLFGKDSDIFTKNELVIFITPRVIIQLDDVDEVTNDFKVKMNEVVSNLRLN